MSSDIYKSATLKLTAWYLALVMAISFIFSAVVYHFATSELAQGLSSQTQRIYKAFPVFSDNPFFVRKNDVATGSHHILLSLFYFNVLVLIAAGFASYWLARRTLQPIEESNERQKRFVADASHELRTPLTALKMSSEVALLDNTLSKQGLRDALHSNLEEADKLDMLLNNLLRLSRLETDEIRHKFASLPVKQLAEAAIEHVKERAGQKHITIADEAGNQLVMGDRDSLIQLLVILLDNAVKYSPEKSTVTLTSSHDTHITTITVSDHGIGIEPAALEHVFDRFYRADKARSHGDSDGFGLGLSIAKHIADLHRGIVTIRSKIGKGTHVSVSLPDQTVSITAS
jgi:two-component system sensor histidine kinase CiaH